MYQLSYIILHQCSALNYVCTNIYYFHLDSYNDHKNKWISDRKLKRLCSHHFQAHVYVYDDIFIIPSDM